MQFRFIIAYAAYRCKECRERCDPDNPWVHLNPDLDLDHRAKPDLE